MTITSKPKVKPTLVRKGHLPTKSICGGRKECPISWHPMCHPFKFGVSPALSWNFGDRSSYSQHLSPSLPIPYNQIKGKIENFLPIDK